MCVVVVLVTDILHAVLQYNIERTSLPVKMSWEEEENSESVMQFMRTF